jgi:hypothetical protein
MENNCSTTFLFSDSGYLIGIGSILNIAGNYYAFNSSKSEDEADRRAIECDWAMIGRDLSVVVEEVTPIVEKSKKQGQLEIFE